MVVAISQIDDVAVVTIDNPPVNAASHAVRQGLVQAVARTDAMEVRAVVLLCTGRTFVAGADIREFGLPFQPPALPDAITVLESATKPWVAALHGTALGGGLEIALGCAYRVAVPSARMGLPEVNLGLLPGAGGTVRLPRLIAPETALSMICSGKPVDAKAALESGLIDAIAPPDLAGDLQAFACTFARSIAGTPKPLPLSARPALLPGDETAWQAQLAQVARKAGGDIAPGTAARMVDFAVKNTGAEALVRERETFMTLRDGDQSKAMRHIFFAERAATKIDEVKGVAPRPLTRIGVVGGGTMGAGIAASALMAGLPVTLAERDVDAATAGQSRVRAILDSALHRGLLTADNHARYCAALHITDDFAALSGADLVIEAVFEDMSVKQSVLAQLEQVLRADAVLATNTSYLDINVMAAGLSDPTRLLGLHFFSPAHIMKLLELVIPQGATADVIATGQAFGKKLGKIVVPAGVCDGFIGNRIMARYRTACDEMLLQGALPQQIDAAMRGFGYKMGLYETQDMAGLDIAWAMRKRRAATRDPNALYVDIADKLCEAGRLGRKTGRGWYLYSDGKTPQTDSAVEAVIVDASARAGVTRQTFTDDEILKTLLDSMRDESRAVLAEGIARTPEAIDVVMVNGYGFPRWHGGPMFGATV